MSRYSGRYDVGSLRHSDAVSIAAVSIEDGPDELTLPYRSGGSCETSTTADSYSGDFASFWSSSVHQSTEKLTQQNWPKVETSKTGPKKPICLFIAPVDDNDDQVNVNRCDDELTVHGDSLPENPTATRL